MKSSTRSSTADDIDDVRTSRLGPEVNQDVRDADVTMDTGPTVPHHLDQPFQPGVDYGSWPPHLDVTMATRIQHSSTVELGM